MGDPGFIIRKCLRPSCAFRFPFHDPIEPVFCPKCGSHTSIVETDFSNKPLPENESLGSPCEIEVLLDNIRSSHNVGSILRTSDGAGVKKVYICGITPPPDHPRVKKTALGAELTVLWEQKWDAYTAISELKQSGKEIWALEGGDNARSVFEIRKLQPASSIVLVLGNEVSGIDPGILEICDRIIYIPMAGVKRSLNVSVAFGIAVYSIRFGI